ncbi:MAG: GIY-YIG nuclease family protein, partial [Verrucomicrobiaceae bacterium]
MALDGIQLGRLIAIEQSLSKVCGEIRTFLAASTPMSQAKIEQYQTKAEQYRPITEQDANSVWSAIFESMTDTNRKPMSVSSKNWTHGYVYCIHDPTHDNYKIGKTTGRPDRRLKALQTGNPNDLMFKFALRSRSVWETETHIHNALAHGRLKGEWFKCPEHEVVSAFAFAPSSEWCDREGHPCDPPCMDDWAEIEILGKESLQFEEREEATT